ncbi:multidrug effflux MFS transporter [Leucothrix pacifica]|uniref:Bcr/CflA family efflux transporter n=1 Tax=Leucothrix pacifica TaxID=1247513 RepID=A0A317CGN6_9GAMM|nr:multidrug effflux MFS transporter [Leucothrix pacifica]PWQ97744.1 Bcr/CflA family drug resistance efflux transporter [Leucothrix pacifica]
MNPVAFPSIWLLATIALASPFAMNVFNPAMPDVVRAFGSSISVVQLTLTLYLAALGVSQLLSGVMADRFGRRPLMLGGMGLHLLGSVLAALAPTIELLILGRILQALGGGATLVLVRTMVLDAHSRNEAGRLLGFITMAIAVAQTIAPTIGGYLNHFFDWRAIFWFSLALNTVIAVIMLRKLTETSVELDKSAFSLRELLKKYITVLRSPVYLGYALTGALITCAYLGFASIMPYIFVDQLGGTSAEYGNWFLIVSIGFFSGSLVCTRITIRLGLDRMIRIGLVLALLAASVLILSLLTGNIAAGLIFLPMGVLTFGRGFVQPNAQSGAVSSVSTNRGTASGMMGFMQLMLASSVSQLMPLLLAQGIVYVFGAVIVLLVLAAVAHWVACRSSSVAR